MVIVRGMYEITELAAGCIGSVGLYMAGCNVLPLQYVPDLPAALFVLSTVIVLHHWRVVTYPPVQKLWRLLLELVALYVATQLLVAFIWEPYHALVDVVRDAVIDTRLGLILLQNFPKFIMFLRQDVCYMGQLVLSLVVTIKAVTYTRSLDYVLPQRRIYQYYDSQATEETFSWAGPRAQRSSRIR